MLGHQSTLKMLATPSRSAGFKGTHAEVKVYCRRLAWKRPSLRLSGPRELKFTAIIYGEVQCSPFSRYEYVHSLQYCLVWVESL